MKDVELACVDGLHSVLKCDAAQLLLSAPGGWVVRRVGGLGRRGYNIVRHRNGHDGTVEAKQFKFLARRNRKRSLVPFG